MKPPFRHLILFILLPGCFLLVGCDDGKNQTAAPVQDEDYWDPAWGPAPDGSNPGTGNGTGTEAEFEQVIQDTAYIVVEKRQAGGNLIPEGVSDFGSQPKMRREPLKSMIIVEGNQTGARSAYSLPPNDYNVVQVGHRLQKSTLSRWDSTTEDHVPPPPVADPTDRSRTGGTAENYAY